MSTVVTGRSHRNPPVRPAARALGGTPSSKPSAGSAGPRSSAAGESARVLIDGYAVGSLSTAAFATG